LYHIVRDFLQPDKDRMSQRWVENSNETRAKRARFATMWNCPKCGSQSEDQFDACWSCTEPRKGSASIDLDSIDGFGHIPPSRPNNPAEEDLQETVGFVFGLLQAAVMMGVLMGPRVGGRGGSEFGDASEKFVELLIRLVLALVCCTLGVSGCIFLFMARKRIRTRVFLLGIALYAFPPLFGLAFIAYHWIRVRL
jgi:hypothetical protein